jgi:carboxylesterase type B
MQRGDHHHPPILEGNVKEEESMLGEKASSGIDTEEKYVSAVERVAASIPGALAAELLRRYPSSDYASHRKAFEAIFADKEYVCTARKVLRALSASQNEFIGRFFYTHAYSGGPLAEYGASHGFELLFIFGTLDGAKVSPTAEELVLVKTFQDMWSSFARTGAPPTSWRRYDANKDNHLIFGTAMSESEHLRANQCDYFDGLGPG